MVHLLMFPLISNLYSSIYRRYCTLSSRLSQEQKRKRRKRFLPSAHTLIVPVLPRAASSPAGPPVRQSAACCKQEDLSRFRRDPFRRIHTRQPDTFSFYTCHRCLSDRRAVPGLSFPTSTNREGESACQSIITYSDS